MSAVSNDISPASATPIASLCQNDTLLKPLRTAIAAAMRPFCVAGDIPLTSALTMTILPDEKATKACAAVTFPSSSAADLAPLIDKLHSDAALVLSKDRFGVIPHSTVDPLVQGILPAIQRSLYPSTDFGGVSQRRVVAQLDKLNVYGVGDFFKGHVDTPRSSDMFGTLLLNLPVKHEGGALVVHAPHGHPEGAEPRKTNWGSDTSIGWIAFFSDCPHEVLPVTSGNRVTLTYNLSIAPPSDEPAAPEDQTLGGVQDVELSSVLEALRIPGLSGTDSPRLCFHFEHRYPVDFNNSTASTALPILKGCDALVYRAFRASGFEVTFHYVCIVPPDRWAEVKETGNKAYILPSRSKESGEGMWEDGLIALVNGHNGQRAVDLGLTEIQPPRDIERAYSQYGYNQTDVDSIIGAPFRYTAYGNEPSVAVDYASICIIASPLGKDINAHWPKRAERRW